MFCVIQKIINKKPNPYGTPKEICVMETTFSLPGQEMKTLYGYTFSNERFERPILDAYKISIHHSYRENGKVKKKQWSICTMGYYDLLESWPGDFITQKELNEKLESMNISEEALWGMVYKKLDPIIEKIKSEFQQTEEYKVTQEHEKILKVHREAEKAFNDEYGYDEYRYCYDVFGNLRNAAYLKKLISTKKQKEDYKRQTEEEFKGSYERFYGGSSKNGSYSTNSHSSYNEEEKKMLHEIYRMASKKFHPDVSGDDGSKMKFLTKLKAQWGL
ncbi:hypothetical protein H9636_02660 [Ureibacillus sp. Re31]|uniref:J domain-containing protein n=1 Tax=Ureibacillus galli TaxID=2762222 RepID=A0ABR8X8P7_9BACL|nr:hypothetical protein [Ureibacillus galli]MBD8025552.1 hypothetical protein [Ureibacillus galli]